MKFLKFLIQDNDCVIIWADQIDDYCYFVALDQDNGKLHIYRWDHNNKVLVEHTPPETENFDWSKYDSLIGLGCSYFEFVKEKGYL